MEKQRLERLGTVSIDVTPYFEGESEVGYLDEIVRGTAPASVRIEIEKVSVKIREFLNTASEAQEQINRDRLEITQLKEETRRRLKQLRV